MTEWEDDRTYVVSAGAGDDTTAPDTDDVTEAIEWLQSRYHLDDLDRDYSRTAAMVDVLVRAVRVAPAVPAAPDAETETWTEYRVAGSDVEPDPPITSREHAQSIAGWRHIESREVTVTRTETAWTEARG